MKSYWVAFSAGLVTAGILFLSAWASGVHAQGDRGARTDVASPRYNMISTISGSIYYINMHNGRVWYTTPGNAPNKKEYIWSEINTPNPKD